MKISDREKKLLIFVGLLVILSCLYFFVYTPFTNNISVMKQEIYQMEQNKAQADLKLSNIKKIEAKSKFIKYELENISEEMPPELTQERILLFFKSIQDSTGMTFKNMSFGTVKLDSELTGTNKNESAQAGSDSNKEKAQIPDGSPISIQVDLSFTANVLQYNEFIKILDGCNNKFHIENLTTESKEGNIQGDMQINFYGIKDSSKNAQDYSNSDLQVKNNAFVNKPFDFYLDVRPFSKEIPSLLIDKCKMRNSLIYGDNENITNVDIQIKEKDGQYLFRYKTDLASYPEDYNAWQEFIPFNNDAIYIRIKEKLKSGSDDKAGVKINITNESPINIIIQTNSPAGQSRAEIVQKSDKISVEYNVSN